MRKFAAASGSAELGSSTIPRIGGASRAKANDAVTGGAAVVFPAASVAKAVTCTVAVEGTWPRAGMNSDAIGKRKRVPLGSVVSGSSAPEAAAKAGQPGQLTVAE